jgi:hypothetical protein
MKEGLSIETERIDDIPLLLTHVQRMKVAELLDKHIPTHGHRKGLSVVWLAHVLRQGKSRLTTCEEVEEAIQAVSRGRLVAGGHPGTRS